MVNEELLGKYIKQLQTLNRATNKNLGKAPHKPILLLSVIQLIQNGEIQNNRIFITGELVIAFKSNWKNLVETKHIPNFSLPFFYLNSEPFWRLVYSNGLSDTNEKISSLGKLKSKIAFAEIDKQLFELLVNPIARDEIENSILNTYFPHTRDCYQFGFVNEYDIEFAIKEQILNDTKEEYQNLMSQLVEELTENEIEEERFIRGSIFKREIPKIYLNQCCISGMRIESSTSAQMIDACHIVPFSVSNNDTVSNGISLSPNLHRAYDRGLITINEDYIVRVSPVIKENETPFSISQFAGRRILLPENYKDYPSPENLIWHKKEVFIF